MKATLLENLEERYQDWALFKRILFYLKPYRLLVAVAIFFLFAVSVLGLAGRCECSTTAGRIRCLRNRTARSYPTVKKIQT